MQNKQVGWNQMPSLSDTQVNSLTTITTRTRSDWNDGIVDEMSPGHMSDHTIIAKRLDNIMQYLLLHTT